MSMKTSTARKMHICEVCYRAIRKGEQYVRPDVPHWIMGDVLAETGALPGREHLSCHEDWMDVGKAIRAEDDWLELNRKTGLRGVVPLDYLEVDWNPETASSTYAKVRTPTLRVINAVKGVE